MAEVWYPGAIRRPIGANHRARRVSFEEVVRNGAICAHSAEGYGSLFNLFNNPARGGSTHLWLSKRGVFEQYILFDRAAWGNGCRSSGSSRSTAKIKDWARRGLCNDYTFASIELEGVAGEAMTGEQFLAAVGFFKWVNQAHGMQLIKDDTVTRHYQYNATACDSDRWPTANLIAAAAEEEDSVLKLPGLWATLNFWYGGKDGIFTGAPLEGWPFEPHADRSLAKFVNDTIVNQLRFEAHVNGEALAAVIPSYKDAEEGDVALCDLGD